MNDIQALNYSTHFREWWRYKRTVASKHALTAVFEIAFNALDHAQHFLLPQHGRLLDMDGKLEGKYAPLLHLPYPVTAFEFYAGQPTPSMGSNQRISTRRISLCFDSEYSAHHKIAPMQDDEWGCMTIAYLDSIRNWVAYPAVTIVSRSNTQRITESHRGEAAKQILALVESGSRGAGKLRALPVGTEVMVTRVHGLAGLKENVPPEEITNDTLDEVTAAVQACAALNCSNVAISKLEASRVLNEKRKRSGKLEFTSYHILEVGDDKAHAVGGNGSHSSPRQHLRRGHIRRLNETRHIWVQSCVVGTSERGSVMKDYRINPHTEVSQ